ncbi:MAG: SpoIVB peptidase S55 domain-containing protein [Bryobacteraceae bacterium]
MRFLAILLMTAPLYAQTGLFPLAEVRPGMQATGRTVFSGSRIEEFQAEILGVLENAGPRQSLILARLSGGPLASTGVLQGMSGSPVYIDGRLVGAVAMTFAYSKEPIAALRPIEDMLSAGAREPERRVRARASLADTDLTLALEPASSVLAGGMRLVDVATPVSFGGFTRNSLEQFGPRLRALGLEPQQGIAGGGRLKPGLGDPKTLEPGSMISVQLLTGDMSVSADGTVTYIDGTRVYAFGHRLLALGSTDIPFARSDVITLVPNLSSSFKISVPREWMGTIRADHSTGVSGEVGRKAAMIPFTIAVTSHSGTQAEARRQVYTMEMVNDGVLSPLLVQMALASTIEATERAVGNSTLAVRGEIRFEENATPIRLNNTYAGEAGLPQMASLAAATPLAYALQSGFDGLRRLRGIDIEVDSYPERRQAQIDQVWTSGREVHPGGTVELHVVLTGPSGAEMSRKVSYRVPIGAATGPLYFTVADGSTANMAEYRQLLVSPPRSPSQLVAFLNSLRSNTSAHVRVWRAQPDFDVQGERFPSPPPSVEQILARSQAGVGATMLSRDAKVGEIEIESGGMVVSGSKTVQVEIKE